MPKIILTLDPYLPVFLLSSLRLNFFRVAMVVGSSIGVAPQCIVETDPESVSNGRAPKLATRPFPLKWSSGLSS